MSVKISPGVQVHLSPIQEEYFLDSEKLIQASSVQGNSVSIWFVCPGHLTMWVSSQNLCSGHVSYQ